MADDRPYPENVTCGLCSHKVNDHNSEVGCMQCDCMATRGEANTQRPGRKAAPVHYPRPVKKTEPTQEDALAAARAAWEIWHTENHDDTGFPVKWGFINGHMMAAGFKNGWVHQ